MKNHLLSRQEKQLKEINWNDNNIYLKPNQYHGIVQLIYSKKKKKIKLFVIKKLPKKHKKACPKPNYHQEWNGISRKNRLKTMLIVNYKKTKNMSINPKYTKSHQIFKSFTDNLKKVFNEKENRTK
jgi:hypothetical protein